MRATAPVLTIFAALCAVAAGCTGGNTTAALPDASAPTAGYASPALTLGDAASKGHAQVVLPLRYNGAGFEVSHYGSCSKVGLNESAVYTAKANVRFRLAKSVTMTPQCLRTKPETTKLYIAVAPVGSTKASYVAGPATWREKPWKFAPAPDTVALSAHHRYVFYVVALPATSTAYPSATPSPTPTPAQNPGGNFVLLQPLSFDGTNFTVVPNTCFDGDPQAAPPYVASSSGALTLSGAVTIAPTCVPSPLPSYSPLPQLYIVAVSVNGNYGYSSKHAARRSMHHNFKLPFDRSWGVPAVAVAGGANITDNPWSFAPDYPGLTTTAGASYAFFIAAPIPPMPTPPPPPPSNHFTAVLPLDYDGTNFTVPSISDCSNLPTPAPYTAPTSAPLTLAGSVSITPTCAPNNGGYGGYGGYARPASGYASPGPLYIVA
ncbi:MAG: hypothetical protein JO199_04400, partial [Candidatus Eremiobacteraeota bacterium]|nr:hypothetical protein [Candidatus Eremiobacteraeota bacterium]